MADANQASDRIDGERAECGFGIHWRVGASAFATRQFDGRVDLCADGALLLFVGRSFLVDDTDNDCHSESTSTATNSDTVDSYRLGNRIFCRWADRATVIQWQPDTVAFRSKWIGLVGVVLFGAVASEHVGSLVGGGTY